MIFSGCQTAGYYTQAIHGQCEILAGRESISKLVKKTDTPPPLKEKFARVLEMREFAKKQLHLPVDGHYETYVDLHRPYVVWNVYAAPEFSLESKAWWYPIVGSLTYRGYFSEPAARRYASSVEKQGFEVYVGGVEAYSTLGWFRDPVLNTFIGHPDADLAETLFHELAHQRVFISGDTDFNEAFATAVADEGVRRWMLVQGNQAAYQQYLDKRAREAQFTAMILQTVHELETLYGTDATASKARKPDGAASDLRERKAQIIARLRMRYAALKQQWGGYDGYDGWMGQPLNNAQLNTVATYYDLVPQFQRMLLRMGGDLEQFYRAVSAMKKLPREERRRRLEAPVDRPG